MSERALESSTRSSVAKSAFILGLAQAWKVVLSFASTIILARLLLPSDFGLVAMIATAMALIVLLQDLGLAQAIIQRPDLSREQVSFLYWCSAAVSLLLAATMVVGAPLLAGFFEEERLVDLTRAYASLVVMGGLQSVPTALLNRRGRFGALALLETVSATGGFVVAVLAAIVWQSYWALFVSALASALLSLGGVWVMTGFRPGLPKFDQGSRELLQFGGSLTGFSFVNYFARNADNVLLGRFHGSVELGFYDRAYRLLLFPIRQLQGTIGRVMVPLLSRLLSNPSKYRQAYLECVTFMLIAAQPGIAFTVVYANEIFAIILGEKWAGSVPIFQVLGIVGLHQVLTSTFGWLFISQARGGEVFRIGTVTSTITVLAFVAGLPWGGVGLAVAYCVSEYVQFPFVWVKIGRRGPVSARDLFTMAVPHAVATIGTILFLVATHAALENTGLLAYFAVLCSAYLVYLSLLICWPGKRSIVVVAIRSLANARLGARSIA